jgi:nucleoside-diphosphate-sugar epimerase
VEGFIRIAECPEAIGQVINIGSGQEISIRNLTNTILRIVGKDIPVICDDQRVRPENSEVQRLCADNSKAQRILGWRPQHTLEDGLAKTIEWIGGNLERYRLGVYTI